MGRKIRNRRRLTQHEGIFYQLYRAWKDAKDRGVEARYIPVHELMGEIYCPEAGKWGYVSYECSARASEMTKANPGLIQRERLRGRSGASYYGYRFNPNPTKDMIKDPAMIRFHKQIKR